MYLYFPNKDNKKCMNIIFCLERLDLWSRRKWGDTELEPSKAGWGSVSSTGEKIAETFRYRHFTLHGRKGVGGFCRNLAGRLLSIDVFGPLPATMGDIPNRPR